MAEPIDRYEDPPIPNDSEAIDAELPDADPIIEDSKPVEQEPPIPDGPEPIDITELADND